MPELVIAPTSTTASAAPVPVQALQPSMRILKRPSASASPSPSSPPSAEAQQKTLAEREAQYRAARDRIFGTPPAGGVSAPAPAGVAGVAAAAAVAENGSSASSRLSSSASPRPQQSQSMTKPVRQPRGPDTVPHGSTDPSLNNASGPKGFGRRGANGSSRDASSRGPQS
jgi:hypothetical protein